MAFWKRKEEEPEPTPLPTVLDTDNWRAWEEAGRKVMGQNDTIAAIPFYIEAVDRFDGNSKELEAFIRRIHADAIGTAKRIATFNRAVPMHLMAEIDREIEVKRPDLVPFKRLTDVMIESCDNAIPAADGPGSVVMLALTALCCTLGYLRFSCDMREDVIRCARASEICVRCMDLVRPMAKANGQMTPGQAFLVLRTYSELAESIKSCEAVVTSAMSDAELDALAEYREEHPVDLLDYLIRALDAANRTIIGRKSDRKRNTNIWMDNVRVFAEVKSTMMEDSEPPSA